MQTDAWHFWSFLYLSPGDLPDPGIEPASLAVAGGFFTTAPPGKPHVEINPPLPTLKFDCEPS